MNFFDTEAQMIVLFLAIAFGYVARKFNIMNDAIDAGLSKVVLSITLPCMIIGSVITAKTLPDPQTICVIFAFSCLAYIVILAIALIVPFFFHLKPAKRGTYSFMMTFGNVGFIGFPVLSSIFGPESLLYGAIFNIPFNLLVFTVGILMLSEKEGSLKEQLKSSAHRLKSPALIACILAMILALLNVTNTGVVGSAFDTIGQMTTPAALLIIGSSLAKMPIRHMISSWRPYIASLFRLAIIPVCVWLVFRPFITDPLLLGVLVITSGMPVATNGTMLCIRYGGDLETMTKGTFISTVLSIVSIPLLVMLV